MSGEIVALLGSLPRDAAEPLANLFDQLADLLRERADADAARQVADRLMADAMERTALRGAAGRRFERDRDIMTRARAGWTNAEIARHLGTSESTVCRTIQRVKAEVARREQQLAAIRAAVYGR